MVSFYLNENVINVIFYVDKIGNVLSEKFLYQNTSAKMYCRRVIINTTKVMLVLHAEECLIFLKNSEPYIKHVMSNNDIIF